MTPNWPTFQRDYIATDDVIGGIGIWLQENFGGRIEIEVGQPRPEKERSFDAFARIGKPAHGMIRVCYQYTYQFTGETSSDTFDVVCADTHIKIQHLSFSYDDPELFEKLTSLIEWVLRGHTISDLWGDIWGEIIFETPDYPDSEKSEQAPRRVTTPKVVPEVRCRGPPYSKAGTWQDGRTPLGGRPDWELAHV